MQRLARTRIVVWEGGSLWLVEATPSALRDVRSTDFHAHHAIQITLSLGGVFRFTTQAGQIGGEAVAVAADASHAFEAEGLFAILFVEPESRPGRAVAAAILGQARIATAPSAGLAPFIARLQANWAAPRNDDDLIGIGREMIAALAADGPADAPDLRVRRMIAWAGEHLEEGITLADAAPIAGLSPGRASHLFVEQTGLPFRTWLLWLRLTRAVESAAAGRALTEAAHEAGFSDSAHLSRTFRRMFGVAPTSLSMT